MPTGDEHPDPDTPPTQTAPGSAGLVESPEPGHGQFQEAYDNVLSAHVRVYDGVKDLYAQRGWDDEPEVRPENQSDG